MNKKTIWGIITIAIILVVIVAINKNISQSNKPIKIGAIFPMTGTSATYGEMAKKAIDLALLSDPNLHDVSVIYEDSQFQSVPALNAYQKLKNDGVKFFMTIGSQVGSTIGPKARGDGLFNFELTAVTPVYRDKSSLTCRAALTADVSSNILANYLKQHGLKRLALFVTDDAQGAAYNSNMKQIVTTFGGSVIESETYQLSDNDFRTQITKIKSAKPDALLLISPGQQAQAILQQLKDLAFNKPVVSNNFTIENASLKNLSLAEGIIFSDFAYGGSNISSTTVDFQKQFKDAYHQDPPIVSATAHDALQLIAKAIKQVGSNPTAVGAWISTTHNYNGVSGKLSFDSDCEAGQGVILKIVKDGQFVPYK